MVIVLDFGLIGGWDTSHYAKHIKDYTLTQQINKLHLEGWVISEITIGKWNLKWKRQWFEWEVNQLTILKQQLGTKTLIREIDDCWVWVDKDSQRFTLSSACRKLLEATIFKETIEFDKFWKVKTLPSAQHFA